MKIEVLLDMHDLPWAAHRAEWLEVDTHEGELRVVERDRDDRITGWTHYAAGRWLEVRLREGPSDDVLQYRQAKADRERTPANGGNGFTTAHPYPASGGYGPGISNSGSH